MKSGFTTLAKLLSICMSLALLGGYVWWRADEQRKDKERLEALNAAEQKAIATIKSNIAEDQAAAEQALKQIQEAKEAELELLMSGSKSELVMPSSKVGIVIDMDKLRKDQPQLFEQLDPEIRKQYEEGGKDESEEGNPVSPSKERVLMPSSKSGGLLPQK